MASFGSRICKSGHAVLPSHRRSPPSPPYITAPVSLLLHPLLLLLSLSSTHHWSYFPSPPHAGTPLPITLSTVTPLLFSQRRFPYTSHFYRYFASTSHPITTPRLFLSPPPRPEVAPVLHPPLVLLPFSSTLCHSPSPSPPPLLLLPLLSHHRSPCTSHLHCHFTSTSHPIATPPTFPVPLPQDQRSPLSSTRHWSHSPSPPPTTTPPPHYLLYHRFPPLLSHHRSSCTSRPIATPPTFPLPSPKTRGCPCPSPTIEPSPFLLHPLSLPLPITSSIVTPPPPLPLSLSPSPFFPSLLLPFPISPPLLFPSSSFPYGTFLPFFSHI